MKASVFLGKRDVGTQEVEERAVGEYEIRVRNKAAGICGTDILSSTVKRIN